MYIYIYIYISWNKQHTKAFEQFKFIKLLKPIFCELLKKCPIYCSFIISLSRLGHFLDLLRKSLAYLRHKLVISLAYFRKMEQYISNTELCTLHIKHCTIHCTLNTKHSKLNTKYQNCLKKHYILKMLSWTLFTEHCTMHTTH